MPDSPPRILPVPAASRTALGPKPLDFDLLCHRADAVLASYRSAGRLELASLVERLLEACDAADNGADLGRLLVYANDVRGLARMLDIDLATEIADTIFALVERTPGGGPPPQKLITTLACLCHQLATGAGSFDPMETATVKALLLALKRKFTSSPGATA